MKQKFNRFGRKGAYKCGICNNLTRDTGRGEAGLGYCAQCLYECDVENAEADYGKDSDEYRNAVILLERLKESQGGKKQCA